MAQAMGLSHEVGQQARGHFLERDSRDILVAFVSHRSSSRPLNRRGRAFLRRAPKEDPPQHREHSERGGGTRCSCQFVARAFWLSATPTWEMTQTQSHFRPARMGLRLALATGTMRDPLRMQQAQSQTRGSWSARRPLSAVSSPATGMSRVQSAGRSRPAAGVTRTAGTISEADSGPTMLLPQRIELPAYLNTPSRRPFRQPLLPEDKTQAIRRIQDLELLTFACRRASKVREEGRAHFSLGVLQDNLGQFQKAIESYNHFLRVCKECNDSQGCALAFHCIAVDYQLLGGGALGEVTGADEETKTGIRPELLKKAIAFHNKHREISDAVGKFVAHLNMGLAYAQLGEREASTVNHQYALRYALQLRSLEGQSLAIGSLGFSAGIYDNDPDKMRVLIERYVELCGALKHGRNQASALKKLGILASQQGDVEQSINYFQQAIKFAREQGDMEAEKDCSVRLGIAAGQARMAEHLSNILQSSVERLQG